LRNTGFIVARAIVSLYVECRQVIEEFINRLMVFKGGTCVGRVCLIDLFDTIAPLL
jgi:hypothetical protein